MNKDQTISSTFQVILSPLSTIVVHSNIASKHRVVKRTTIMTNKSQ